jgi:hypothetical protein
MALPTIPSTDSQDGTFQHGPRVRLAIGFPPAENRIGGGAAGWWTCCRLRGRDRFHGLTRMWYADYGCPVGVGRHT